MVTLDATRLVVVEDDEDMLFLLRDTLEAEGYNVSTFVDAPPALRHVQTQGLPHLVLIDLKLPTMHGFDLSQRLKALGDVPIVFISTTGDTDTVVDGLNRFADDYVTKPFELRELVARVRRVLSRMQHFDYALPPIIQVDDWLAIDFGNSRVVVGGKSVTLTPTEAGLLHILTRQAGDIVPSAALIARVWPTEIVYEETLRVHMHRLRRKLEPDYHKPRYIKTERGVGYRFDATLPTGADNA